MHHHPGPVEEIGSYAVGRSSRRWPGSFRVGPPGLVHTNQVRLSLSSLTSPLSLSRVTMLTNLLPRDSRIFSGENVTVLMTSVSDLYLPSLWISSSSMFQSNTISSFVRTLMWR